MSGLILSAALLASPALADDEAKYSTAKTTIDVLMADEAAMAVLQDEIPDVVNNDQIGMAVGMTLHDIAMYAPDMLTAEKLKTIDTKLSEIE
ncbi:MAG: hypothetical protein CMK09_05195 [Ponticaulis sp.]|nr:hypothetical protein [Ponticaulis sp.]